MRRRDALTAKGSVDLPGARWVSCGASAGHAHFAAYGVAFTIRTFPNVNSPACLL